MENDSSIIQTSRPLNAQTIFADLRDALATLYPNEIDARVVVDDTGLDAKQIAFSTRAQTNWHNILVEAIRQNHLTTLLDVVLTAYGNNPALQLAYTNYCRFFEQRGVIPLPIQPSEPSKSRIPLQRPPRAAYFQDRKDDLTQLLIDLQAGWVVTLCGPGGIGKTALAAEAIWQLAPGPEPPACFPDGILFHSFYNQPQVTLALEHIARTFGEEVKPTPKAAAQRALAGRRALLILDGTEQADDLRQVVDIRDQCGLLITSRIRKDQADKRQDIAPLPLEDAVVLLQAWGESRATDTNAVRHIAELVGRLPLALRLVGRYLIQNEENASDYLTWLAATPLTALDHGHNPEQSIPLLLACSLKQVNEQARQVLGMVGLLALAPFAREPIAAALQLSTVEARQALGELVNYGLLMRPTESYEVTHALIHTYARLQLAPPTEHVTRLATYYTTLIQEHSSDFVLLNSIRPHVLTLLRSCGERKSWEAVESLTWAIKDYLDLRGYWTERITVLEMSLAAAQATQGRRDDGVTLSNLGLAYAALGQVEQAIDYHQQALAIFKAIGDRRGEGAELGNLGEAYAALGQVEQAIDYHQQALAISKEIGDRRGEGVDLGNLGLAYAALGQVEQAIDYYQQALAIAKQIRDRRNEGCWLDNLGLVYRNLGRVEQAKQVWEQALRIYEEIKSPNANRIRQWLASK